MLGTGWVRHVLRANVFAPETDLHRVTVTLPGNFVERFDMEVLANPSTSARSTSPT